MQYMLLVYEPANGPEARAKRMAELGGKHMALAAELIAAGVQKEGAGLQGIDTATTIATAAGGAQTLHDGPFAETREYLGGYYVIEVADLDAALAVAKRVPVGEHGKVEVRPLMVY